MKASSMKIQSVKITNEKFVTTKVLCLSLALSVLSGAAPETSSATVLQNGILAEEHTERSPRPPDRSRPPRPGRPPRPDRPPRTTRPPRPNEDRRWSRHRDIRRNWIHRHRRHRILPHLWQGFWAGLLLADWLYDPPYPYMNGYYYAPRWDYRRTPEPYFMEVVSEVGYRATPSAASDNICGFLGSGMYVPVLSLTRSQNTTDVWAVVAVDPIVRSTMTNPGCFHLNYVYVPRLFLR